jgi:leader peptidase (prepilin peptidase) / N-methyltransferase
MSLFYILVFILGTLIGSFLNVVILRYNTGKSFVSGRSFCMSCSKKLSFFELIPVFSFVFLGGRCGGCKSKISFQYALVELLTGLLFLALAFKYSHLLLVHDLISFIIIFVFYSLIFSILLVIFFYDLRHMIIPDGLVYGVSFLALIPHLIQLSALGVTKYSLLNILAGPILFSVFGLIWFFSKGRAMGFGDAKLALAIGLLLGFSAGVTSIVLSFWVGAIFGVSLILISKLHHNKDFGLKTAIPFGPFLIIGFLLSFFFKLDIVWMSNLFV